MEESARPDADEKKDPDLNIDFNKIKKAALVLRAINHPVRQEILRTIYWRKSITVTQIYTIHQMEQSVASQHLAILRKAGIVLILHVGKHRYYSLNTSRIDDINTLAKNLFILS